MAEDGFPTSQTDARIPDDWVTHMGPANWFQFRCPPSFRVRTTNTLIEILSPLKSTIANSTDSDSDSDSSYPNHSARTGSLPLKADDPRSVRSTDSGSIADEANRDAAETREFEQQPLMLLICCSWIGEGAAGHRAVSEDVSTLFPTPILIEQVRTKHPTAEIQTWRGFSKQPASGSFWRRWFGKRRLYQWKLWSLVCPPLSITATITSGTGLPLDAEFSAQCELITASIRFSESPCWPPDVFRQHVVDLARRYFPLLEVSPTGAFSIRLAASDIHLGNFYRAYLIQPSGFRQIVLPGITSVVRLQELSPDQLIPPLEIARTRILPMLSTISDEVSDGLVRIPWVAGLSVSFVLDEADSYRFIHHAMLLTWKLSADELQDLALHNLQRYSADHPLEVTMIGDHDDPRILMPVKPDAYNCVRLLDPRFHTRLRELFGPELLVGVPNRDFFVAVSLNHPALIPEVQDRVRQDYGKMHYPLTSRLLVISADGVSEYC